MMTINLDRAHARRMLQSRRRRLLRQRHKFPACSHIKDEGQTLSRSGYLPYFALRISGSYSCTNNEFLFDRDKRRGTPHLSISLTTVLSSLALVGRYSWSLQSTY